MWIPQYMAKGRAAITSATGRGIASSSRLLMIVASPGMESVKRQPSAKQKLTNKKRLSFAFINDGGRFVAYMIPKSPLSPVKSCLIDLSRQKEASEERENA